VAFLELFIVIILLLAIHGVGGEGRDGMESGFCVSSTDGEE